MNLGCAPRGQRFRAQPMDLCLEGRHPVLPCAAHSNGRGLPSTFLPLRLRSSASPPTEPPLPSFSQGPPCPRKRTSARRRQNSLRAEDSSIDCLSPYLFYGRVSMLPEAS